MSDTKYKIQIAYTLLIGFITIYSCLLSIATTYISIMYAG